MLGQPCRRRYGNVVKVCVGGECLPGALLFHLLSQLQAQIYPLMQNPPKLTKLDCTPPLQSTLHTQAIALNWKTPNVPFFLPTNGTKT